MHSDIPKEWWNLGPITATWLLSVRDKELISKMYPKGISYSIPEHKDQPIGHLFRNFFRNVLGTTTSTTITTDKPIVRLRLFCKIYNIYTELMPRVNWFQIPPAILTYNVPIPVQNQIKLPNYTQSIVLPGIFIIGDCYKCQKQHAVKLENGYFNLCEAFDQPVCPYHQDIKLDFIHVGAFHCKVLRTMRPANEKTVTDIIDVHKPVLFIHDLPGKLWWVFKIEVRLIKPSRVTD